MGKETLALFESMLSLKSKATKNEDLHVVDYSSDVKIECLNLMSYNKHYKLSDGEILYRGCSDIVYLYDGNDYTNIEDLSDEVKNNKLKKLKELLTDVEGVKRKNV